MPLGVFFLECVEDAFAIGQGLMHITIVNLQFLNDFVVIWDVPLSYLRFQCASAAFERVLVNKTLFPQRQHVVFAIIVLIWRFNHLF